MYRRKARDVPLLLPGSVFGAAMAVLAYVHAIQAPSESGIVLMIALYLGPVLGITAGVLAYAMTRKRGRMQARKCLQAGMMVSAIMLLGLLLYYVISFYDTYLPPFTYEGYDGQSAYTGLGILHPRFHPMPEECHDILHGLEGECVVSKELAATHDAHHARWNDSPYWIDEICHIEERRGTEGDPRILRHCT